MLLWRAVDVRSYASFTSRAARSSWTPEERLFCPVLSEWLARSTADDRSRRLAPQGSFVVSFSIDDPYASGFEPHTVRREHEELWVPAEQLWELNEHIEGPIRLVSASFGAGYRGHVPSRFGMRRKRDEQFCSCRCFHNTPDFRCESGQSPPCS
jgi:hypothetical protein